MEISVVIPAYNEEQFLPRCLHSLRKQTYPKNQFEVIVVDNNSTDKTAYIARQFGTRVLFEAKRGVTYARQNGANSALGDIIVGIDADCEVGPGFLQQVAKEFKNKKIVGLCGTVYFDDAPAIVVINARLLTLFAHYFSKFSGRTPLCWAGNFSFRKNRFVETGGYNLNLPLVVAGYNTQGSDEHDMAKRLMTKNNQAIFNKHISLTTSGRRFKNRLLYWFFVEYLVGFLLNRKIYSLFGFLLPISTYERIAPKKLYTYMLSTLLFLLVLAMVSPLLYFLFITLCGSTSVSQTAQREIKKGIIELRQAVCVNRPLTTKKW